MANAAIQYNTTLFYQRISRGSSPILRVLLQLKQEFVSSLLVKYNIPFLVCPKHIIKARIWDSFITRAENYGYVDNSA